MEDNFILVGSGVYGVYFIDSGKEKELKEKLAVLKMCTVDTLSIIEYNEEDIEELKEDVVKFNEKFKGLVNLGEPEEKNLKEVTGASGEEKILVDESILEDDDDDIFN